MADGCHFLRILLSINKALEAAHEVQHNRFNGWSTRHIGTRDAERRREKLEATSTAGMLHGDNRRVYCMIRRIERPARHVSVYFCFCDTFTCKSAMFQTASISFKRLG